MSERNDRAASIMHEVAATFIRNEANSTPLITVTRIDVGRDQQHATILISVLPTSGEADALTFLKRKGGEFRSYLKKHSRLKYIPFFDFEIDYGEKNRQMLDEIAEDATDGDAEGASVK